MEKLSIACLCPNCGSEVPITKSLASRVLAAGAKPKSREHYQKAGRASAAKRWGKAI
jgi:hypothetical protein